VEEVVAVDLVIVEEGDEVVLVVVVVSEVVEAEVDFQIAVVSATI